MRDNNDIPSCDSKNNERRWCGACDEFHEGRRHFNAAWVAIPVVLILFALITFGGIALGNKMENAPRPTRAPEPTAYVSSGYFHSASGAVIAIDSIVCIVPCDGAALGGRPHYHVYTLIDDESTDANAVSVEDKGKLMEAMEEMK